MNNKKTFSIKVKDVGTSKPKSIHKKDVDGASTRG